MLRITDVDYIKDYELLLKFSDGSKKKVDLRPYLTGEVFGELLDKSKFIPIRFDSHNDRMGERSRPRARVLV